MSCNRLAASVGYFSKVSRMKLRYGSTRLWRNGVPGGTTACSRSTRPYRVAVHVQLPRDGPHAPVLDPVAGVNYLVRPATTILAGGRRGDLLTLRCRELRVEVRFEGLSDLQNSGPCQAAPEAPPDRACIHVRSYPSRMIA